MIYNDDDNDYLQMQIKKLRESKHRLSEHAKELEIDRKRNAWADSVMQRHKQKQAEKRPLGCSLFIVVALAWCFIACAPSRAFKQQAAAILDQDRQMHYYACIEPVIDDLTGLVEVSEWPHLFPQDICEQWEAKLIEAEPTLEDEFAKQRALQVFIREKVIPWALPYIEQGAYTAASALLAYLTGGLLSGALQAAAAP